MTGARMSGSDCFQIQTGEKETGGKRMEIIFTVIGVAEVAA